MMHRGVGCSAKAFGPFSLTLLGRVDPGDIIALTLECMNLAHSRPVPSTSDHF